MTHESARTRRSLGAFLGHFFGGGGSGSLKAAFRKSAKAKGTMPGKKPLVSARSEIRNHRLVLECYKQMALGRREIETSTNDEALAQQLMDRVIAQWQELGAAEPYFSNDNKDEYKAGNIGDPAIRSFYQGGEQWMKTLAAFESRSGCEITNGICIELGAGVGRYTQALARRFAQVVAIDVSQPLLDINAARSQSLGIANVTTFALKSPRDLGTFGQTDFFLAQAVLLHNPPPIQRMLLNEALASLRPGGFALFQTPDWLEGYVFSTRAFVENAPETACDCHCLPKADVLQILRENNMILLDFHSDFLTESYGSYLYFARKNSA